MLHFYPNSFLYSRNRRHRANHRRTVFHIDNRQCQREDKQQRTGDLVQDAVVSYELLSNDIAVNDVENLYASDDADPDVNPNGEVQDRQQFDQTNYNKDDVRNRV